MSLGKFRLAEGTQLSLEVEHLGSLSSTHQNSAQIEKHETIQKLKDRDPVFLKALFKDMNPRLLKLSASHGVYTEAAEELVHECWETFFTNLGKFEGRSTIRTFMFGILINKIREHRRRTKRLDYEEDSEKVFARSFSSDGWWVNEPKDPHRLLASKRLAGAINDCLLGLTDSQRMAFLLIESEGESSENASRIMGVSISNLRVLLFRAKDKLRLCLEGKV